MTGQSSAAPLEVFASRWVVALFALAGLIIGMILFGLREPTYESSTIVSVNNPLGTMGDEAALVLSDRVLSPATSALGFQPEIEVEPNEVADLLTITVRASDPDDAARAASQVAQSYVQSQTTVAVRIADPAESNPSPVAPNRLTYVLIGSVVGALVGAAIGSLKSLGRIVPRRAEPVERPAPIRPARQPSAELASAMGADVAGQGERYDPAPTGITDNQRATRDSVVARRSVNAVAASAASATIAPTPAPAPVATPAPATATAPVAAPAPASVRSTSNAFSAAASSMVETPSPPTPSWRTGDMPAVATPTSRPSPAPVTDAVTPILLDDPADTDEPTETDTGSDEADESEETDTDIDEIDDHATVDTDIDEADEPTTANTDADEAPDTDVDEAPDTDLYDTETDITEEAADTGLDAADTGSGTDKPTGVRDSGPIITDHDLDEASRFTDEPTENEPIMDKPTIDDERPVEERAAARTRAAKAPRQSQAPRASSIESVRELEDNVAHYETLLNDQSMAHAEELSTVEAGYERDLSDLKRLLAEARKQARLATAQIKRLSGDDQHRIGDLQAQVTALESEISSLRDQLESERINHVRELTTERDVADRALDNARRDYRSRLDANESDSRRSLSESRTELDELLSKTHFDHQTALERQHNEYEEALASDRERHKGELARLAERHREELAKTKADAEEAGERQARQIRQTLAQLRASEKRLTTEVGELHQNERQFRAELSAVGKKHRTMQQKTAETEQLLRDELAVTKKFLHNEKERNAALRDDVVRRTAEAHQAVDRAIDDRSAKLAELEALVARQREHSEQRVREANASAEERARVSTRRESELTARITRLERELEQIRPKSS